MSEKTLQNGSDLIENVTELELQEEVEVQTEETVSEESEKPKTKSGLLSDIYEEMSSLDKSSLSAIHEELMDEKKVEEEDDDEEAEDEVDDEDEVDEEAEVDEKRMTPAEKKAQAKYRKSAAGKKSAKLSAKKRSRPGYRPDKARSKAATKAAKFRKEDIDFKDDVNALLSADPSLSEEFQDKATVIFETAVASKVSVEIDRLEEEYSVQLTEETESIKGELSENVNSYLTYVVEQWMTDNKVAVENGIRMEVTESFMESLKGVFNEHYIEVPEAKADMVDELAEEVTDLERQVNKMTNDNIKLSEEVRDFKKGIIITEASKDMVSTEVEKLKSLVEDIDFENEETFQNKVTTIKESYFSKTKKYDAEKAEIDTGSSIKDKVEMTKSMEAYSAAISNTLK